MNIAERNAELVSQYTEANTEFLAASMAVTAKYVSMVGPAEAELKRLNDAIARRTALDRELQALVMEAFGSGLKFPS